MGKRKVRILEPAATAVAEIAFFIEAKGLTKTAMNFVDEAYDFFDKLSDDRLEHRPCVYSPWKSLNYRCVTFSKKYMVAYLSTAKEIIICEFVSSKILKD